MKNKFFKNFTLFSLSFLFVFSFIFLTACGDDNQSKIDVKNVHAAISEKFCNPQGYLSISISPSVVQADVAADDKYQVFPKILDNFVDYASGAVFSLAFRSSDFDYALSSFSNEQLSQVHSKFSKVLSHLESLDKVKSVYENSNGHLQYNELVCQYFHLIDALYSLTDSFQAFYLSGLYQPNFTANTITKTSISNVLWLKLYSLSKVSYFYELKDYVVDESDGAVENWLFATEELRPFIYSASDLLQALKTNADLTQGISSEKKASLAERFNNMLSLKNAFENDFCIFLSSAKGVNLKEYFSAPNQLSYLENLPTFERSKFSLIFQFLSGRYRAFADALSSSTTLLNINP